MGRTPAAGARDSPGGGALPHIAHHALEGLGAVPEGADAAVPVAVIRGGLRLPLRPAGHNRTRRRSAGVSGRPRPAPVPRPARPATPAPPPSPGAAQRRGSAAADPGRHRCPLWAAAARRAPPHPVPRHRPRRPRPPLYPTWSGSSCRPCSLPTRASEPRPVCQPPGGEGPAEAPRRGGGEGRAASCSRRRRHRRIPRSLQLSGKLLPART